MGPLYDLYLLFFTFLPFPISINLEFIITHIFAIFCLKKLLDRYSPWWVSWTIVTAWIPYLCIFESTKYVAGAGFLCLHFSLPIDSKWRKNLFPPYLIASIMCSQGYVFFYIGHLVGTIIVWFSSKQQLVFPKLKLNKIFFVQALLFLIIIISMFLQSPRKDNNPFMIDSAYYPVPSNSHMTIAFFQIENFLYTTRNYPEAKWKTLDWYDSNQEVFGGAQTIFQAIKFRPKVVLQNVLANLNDLKGVPAFFITGQFALKHVSAKNFVVKVFSFLLVLFAIYFHLRKLMQDRKSAPLSISLLLGGLSLVVAILLTWVNFRFFMQLLPFFVVFWGETTLDSQVWQSDYNKLKQHKLTKIIASFLLLIFLGGMLFPHKVFPQGNWITSFNFLLMMVPILFMIGPESILKYKKMIGGFCIVLVVSLVLTSFSWPKGIEGQIKNIFNGHSFLNQSSPVSYTSSYQALRPYIQNSKRFISNEENLFEGLYDLGLDKAIMSTALPPQSIDKQIALNMLAELDLILVSKAWATDSYEIGTQDLYKYQIHVKPFLEEQVKKGTWKCDRIEWYGEACAKL